MTLLSNAVSAIDLAIGDAASGEEKRLLSCVRNLHAGILLLFKEKLLRLSPPGSDEVLLKQKIRPVLDGKGQVTFIGLGRNTVDVQDIQQRFASLNVSANWPRFERVNRLRNDIEHYYTTVSPTAIEGAVSDAFILIRDFIKNELKEDPLTVLGKTTWDAMLKASEVFEAERKDCQEKIGKTAWNSKALESGVRDLECNKCGSPLLQPEDGAKTPSLRCVSCGNSREFEDYVEDAIEHACGIDNYLSVKDGGEPASTACPFCCKDTYIVAEGKCATCGEECENTCARCGMEIPVSELNDGDMCGWCAHMMAKDD